MGITARYTLLILSYGRTLSSDVRIYIALVVVKNDNTFSLIYDEDDYVVMFVNMINHGVILYCTRS